MSDVPAAEHRSAATAYSARPSVRTPHQERPTILMHPVPPAGLGAFLSWENEQASAKLVPEVLWQLGTVPFDRLHPIAVRRRTPTRGLL